ncbi:MAG TPA: EamA family transporter [Candidatus Dormibacteraeota bacterium]|jgi:inner membrane transporter RhtA
MPSNQLQRIAALRSATVPPHAYFMGSAVFHYLGPSFAVLLFARVDVLGVAWLRIASAALIFAVWRRPWRAFLALDRGGQLLIVALGAVFALMNVCFYISINRLPLATVAAIEFMGPIVLAAIGARVPRNFAAILAAGVGVYLLTHARFVGEPLGVGFAFANAALFAAYIVLAHRVAQRSRLGDIDGLAAAMLFAFIFVSPIGLRGATHAFADPVALAAGIGVGVSSSVIPYVFDQLAMARLARATYALFVALLPATATGIGVIVLRQLPTPVDLAGIALVMLGVVLHRDRSVPEAPPPAVAGTAQASVDASSPAGSAPEGAPLAKRSAAELMQ